MLTVRRHAARAFAALLLLLVVSADAGATRWFEAEPAGSVSSAGRLQFTGGAYTVECNVTLSGSIPQGELNAIVGTRHGTITGAAIAGCNGGSITATLGLPWSLDYDGFTGTLPAITSLRYRINRLAFNFNVFGFNCLYSGAIPVQLALTPTGQTAAFSIVPGAQVQSTSGGVCPSSGTLSATFSLTQQQILQDRMTIISLGDSYISGEAGRWAGNTDTWERTEYFRIDALGTTAYNDGAGAELIPLCHRSRSAEIHIRGPRVLSYNLACSGAITATGREGSDYKPGLDNFDGVETGGVYRQSQVTQLRLLARRHRQGIKMIVVSIGGNDFGFGPAVAKCVEGFLALPPFNFYCSRDARLLERFTPQNMNLVRDRIRTALWNIRNAMNAEGYADNAYKILVQNYPEPLPETGTDLRMPETTWERQYVEGCGFWNVDVNWAVQIALTNINFTVGEAVYQSGLPNVLTMNIRDAFEGRRLCERGVGRIEQVGITDWALAEAVDRSEWINQIRTLSTIWPETPYRVQEGLHPNYWGQLALRNCVRQAFNNGTPRGGTCVRDGTGRNDMQPREPRMRLI